MRLRTLHRTVGVIFGPFFLLTACTGILLLFRKTDLYEVEVQHRLVQLHNWELVTSYVGIILALGLITMVLTGGMLFLRTRRSRPR